MKRHLIMGIALATGLGSAHAADLPVKAPAAAPVPFSWTGAYVGVDVGARWTDDSWRTICIEVGFGGASCPNTTALAQDQQRFFFNNPAGLNSTSARVAVHAGYNWQVGTQWLLGAEADFAWANNGKTIAGIPGTENPTFPGAPGLDTANVRQNWDASLRGRLGFLATPKVLLYGTGGLAFTQASASANCVSAYQVGWCSGGVPASSLISSTMTGWTAGVGIEGVLWGNWLGRAEWRHSDYGNLSGTFFSAPSRVAAGDAFNSTISVRTETVSVGISYKFGPGPIVAKY